MTTLDSMNSDNEFADDDDVFLSPSSDYPPAGPLSTGVLAFNGSSPSSGYSSRPTSNHNHHEVTSAGLTVRTNDGRSVRQTPSPTGYRGYVAPEIPTSLTPDEDDIIHKTILLGDSGVGKTSLLVQFDTGKFQQGTFSATVGIGFTVVLLGDSGVGKTCFLMKFKDGHFLSGSYISTVGIDFRNKVVNVDDSRVKLQIWDTAGQERFRSVTHAYYRDAHALLLLYDVGSKTSFDNTRAWLAEVHEYAQPDVVIMLIANKCDKPYSERQIRKEDGERLAREYNVAFMETSAKSGLNVDLAFTAVAKDLKTRKSDNIYEKRFNVSDYVQKEAKSQPCACSVG